MSLNRRVFVLGGHVTPFIGKKHPDFIWKRHPDFGKRENPSLEDYISQAVNGALKETGVDAKDVEKAWIGNFVGELFSNQGHLGAAVVGANKGLMFKPVMRVEGACASGGLAFASAVEAIQAGTNVAMAVGAEVQSTRSAREGGDFLARASHYARQRQIDDFTFPAMFARRTKVYRAAFDVSEEDIGRVSVKAYNNANKNERAHMKAVKMTLEQASSANDRNPCFLSNEEFAPFMKMSDCSQVSDGGAALIVVSEEGLKKLGKTEADAIELIGIGHATGNLYEDADLTKLDCTIAAKNVCFEQAQIKAEDIQVTEVHDCFAITELLMIEALGLAEIGKGAEFVKAGHADITGSCPVNTGGGLIGYGHPVGATGVKQILEIHRQMKGAAGGYQMPSIPAIGVTANMGGDDKTAVVCAFRNL